MRPVFLPQLIACVVLLCALPGCGRQRGPMAVDPDAPKDFQTTQSGLKYRILRRSDGPKPTALDSVTVDYTGKLDDGSVFDSSYNRNQPITFRLDSVVPGWTEGLQLVGEGGMIELIIPPQLGYGSRSIASIPPNSTLHFRVELHGIK